MLDPSAIEVATILASVLVGWPCRFDDGDDAYPALRLGSDADTFVVERPATGFASRHADPLDAACTAIVEIVDDFVAAASDLACLHAAAADFAGRAVLFPATHRAGKSTLMARLSAEGRRVFSDDLLPVDLTRREALSTGCLPRIRLPLPRGCGTLLRRAIEDRSVRRSRRYAYLGASPGCEVHHGERAGIGAIVLLERRTDQKEARLVRASLGEAMFRTLSQTTRHASDAGTLLQRMHAALADLPCWRLDYSTVDQAADILSHHFKGGEGFAQSVSASRRNCPRSAADTPVFAGETVCFQRRAAVTMRMEGGAAFLVDAARGEILSLSPLGAGLWELLERPMPLEALVGVVAGAFPEIGRKLVHGDVARLLHQLEERKLVDRHP